MKPHAQPLPPDPLDSAEAALVRTRALLKDADADENEITVNVHVNTGHPPQPSAPELAVQPARTLGATIAGIVAGLAGLASAGMAIAKALGWL